MPGLFLTVAACALSLSEDGPAWLLPCPRGTHSCYPCFWHGLSKHLVPERKRDAISVGKQQLYKKMVWKVNSDNKWPVPGSQQCYIDLLFVLFSLIAFKYAKVWLISRKQKNSATPILTHLLGLPSRQHWHSSAWGCLYSEKLLKSVQMHCMFYECRKLRRDMHFYRRKSAFIWKSTIL